MRRAYGLGDYELARALKRWGGGYYLAAPSATGGSFARIRYVQDCSMGSPRIEAVRYSDVAVDDSSGVFCLVHIYERMVKVRGVVSKKALREEYEIGKKEAVSGAKRNTVFTKKYARLLPIRGRGRASGVKKRQGNLEYRIGTPARWRFLSIERFWLYRYASREIGQF